MEYRDPAQRTELHAEGGQVHVSCSLCGEPLGSYSQTTLAEVQEVALRHRHPVTP